MATSGTTSFNLSVDELIIEAYERCAVPSPTGQQLRSARRSLNLLLADLNNRDLHLFKRAQSTFNTVASQTSYTLSGAVLDVSDVTVHADGTTGSEISVARLTQSDYAALPNKTTEARPSQYYLDRERDAPILFLYTTPDKVYKINYYAYNRIEDVGAYTNTLDVPVKFLPAVTTGLAFYLSQKVAPDRTQALKLYYEDELARALAEDGSASSSYITPKAYYPAQS